MTTKQRRILETFISRRADMADVQAIEKLCEARRQVMLRMAVRADRSDVITVAVPLGRAGEVLQ